MCREIQHLCLSYLEHFNNRNERSVPYQKRTVVMHIRKDLALSGTCAYRARLLLQSIEPLITPVRLKELRWLVQPLYIAHSISFSLATYGGPG